MFVNNTFHLITLTQCPHVFKSIANVFSSLKGKKKGLVGEISAMLASEACQGLCLIDRSWQVANAIITPKGKGDKTKETCIVLYMSWADIVLLMILKIRVGKQSIANMCMYLYVCWGEALVHIL